MLNTSIFFFFFCLDKFNQVVTINRRLSREDDHHQLQALVGVLEVPEHGLHAVRPLGVLAEARLTLDGHPCISRDLPQLVSESSAK